MRIYQPQDKKSPMAWSRLIDQLERLDPVLERVGESQQAALWCGYGAEVLVGWFLSETA